MKPSQPSGSHTEKSCAPNNDERAKIRSHLRSARKALSAAALAHAEQALLQNCLPLIQTADSVAGYQAIMGEIPVGALLKWCQEQQKTTLLPIMQTHNYTLLFAPFDQQTPMSSGQFGIQQPDIPAHQLWQPAQVDTVLVPLVAFDKQCNRLGMGGGYYDRSFSMRTEACAPPTLIGVAHSLQEVTSLPIDWWDVPLDYIVTDQAVFKRPNSMQSG